MQLLHLPQPSISWAKISQRPGDRLLEGEQGTGEQPGWPVALGGGSLGILGSTEVSFSLTLHSEDAVRYFPVRLPSSFFLLNPVQLLRTLHILYDNVPMLILVGLGRFQFFKP